MELINEKDETLFPIGVETQGRCELDPDSGEPGGNCGFAKLSQAGYTGASLDSADKRGCTFSRISLPLGLPRQGTTSYK